MIAFYYKKLTTKTPILGFDEAFFNGELAFLFLKQSILNYVILEK